MLQWQAEIAQDSSAALTDNWHIAISANAWEGVNALSMVSSEEPFAGSDANGQHLSKAWKYLVIRRTYPPIKINTKSEFVNN